MGTFSSRDVVLFGASIVFGALLLLAFWLFFRWYIH